MVIRNLKTDLFLFGLLLSIWIGNTALVAQQQQIESNDRSVKQDTVSVADGNLVDNSAFDKKGAWKFDTYKGAAGTIYFDKEAKIVIEKGGEKLFSIQLYQNKINLESNQTYRITFRTKAEKKTRVSYRVAKIGKPFTGYTDYQAFEADSSWKTITHQFTMDKTGDPNARLAFNVGKQTETVYFDDVRIEKVESSKSKKTTALADSKAPEEAKGNKPFNVVKHLRKQIDVLTDTETKLNKEQRKTLQDHQFKLEVAEYIEQQVDTFEMTPLSTGGFEYKLDASADDSFLIAKIKVGSNTKVAEFVFANLAGVEACTKDLYYFAKGTPKGGYRDYRIVGRYSDEKMAEVAIVEVRKQYDAQKKYQAQMLSYIKKRAKEAQQKKNRNRAMMSKFGGGSSGSGGSVTSACRT